MSVARLARGADGGGEIVTVDAVGNLGGGRTLSSHSCSRSSNRRLTHFLVPLTT